MKKLALCIAVLGFISQVQANSNPLGNNEVDLKSTGYIDIEQIKRDNPVPEIDLDKQRGEAENALSKYKEVNKPKVPESTLNRLNLGEVKVKKQVTPEILNDKNLKNQLGTIDLEDMAKKYNESMAKAKQNKPENPAEELVAGKAYLFISASIPKKTLEPLLNDAGRLGISVFLNGNIGPDPLKFAGTQAFMNTMKIDTPPELFIHPDAFKMFKIDKVPALVVSASTVNDNLDEQGCAAPNDFDIIRGDLSVTSNITRIFEQSSSPDIKDIARQYMKKINVTN